MPKRGTSTAGADSQRSTLAPRTSPSPRMSPDSSGTSGPQSLAIQSSSVPSQGPSRRTGPTTILKTSMLTALPRQQLINLCPPLPQLLSTSARIPFKLGCSNNSRQTDCEVTRTTLSSLPQERARQSWQPSTTEGSGSNSIELDSSSSPIEVKFSSRVATRSDMCYATAALASCGWEARSRLAGNTSSHPSSRSQ